MIPISSLETVFSFCIYYCNTEKIAATNEIIFSSYLFSIDLLDLISTLLSSRGLLQTIPVLRGQQGWQIHPGQTANHRVQKLNDFIVTESRYEHYKHWSCLQSEVIRTHVFTVQGVTTAIHLTLLSSALM